MAGKTQTKAVIAPKKRRLTDLYVVGKPLVFDEDSDDPIEVWLSKLSPVQQRDAADNATGARAKLLSLKMNPDSDPRQVAVFQEQLSDLGVNDRDSKIEFLMVPKVQEARAAAQARIAGEEKWSDNDYLNSLQSAWNDGLADKFAKDEEDEEAKRVYDELIAFTDAVEEAVEEERDVIRVEFTHFSDEELDTEVLNRAIDAEADFAWVNEFSRWQIFYATREPSDHKALYFDTRSEVDELDPKITNRILEEYNAMVVDPVEGKD